MAAPSMVVVVLLMLACEVYGSDDSDKQCHLNPAGCKGHADRSLSEQSNSLEASRHGETDKFSLIQVQTVEKHLAAQEAIHQNSNSDHAEQLKAIRMLEANAKEIVEERIEKMAKQITDEMKLASPNFDANMSFMFLTIDHDEDGKMNYTEFMSWVDRPRCLECISRLEKHNMTPPEEWSHFADSEHALVDRAGFLAAVKKYWGPLDDNKVDDVTCECNMLSLYQAAVQKVQANGATSVYEDEYLDDDMPHTSFAGWGNGCSY